MCDFLMPMAKLSLLVFVVSALLGVGATLMTLTVGSILRGGIIATVVARLAISDPGVIIC